MGFELRLLYWPGILKDKTFNNKLMYIYINDI